MTSLFLRIVRQMKNDKRVLVLMLAAPLLIITLLYLLLGESPYQPVIAVDSSIRTELKTALAEQDAKIITVEEKTSEDDFLRNNSADAFVTFDSKGMHVRMLESTSTKVSKISDVLKKAIVKVNPAGNMDFTFIYGKTDDTVFDSLGYMLLGVLSFFFVFIISGISFVRERTTGTLERLMLSPVSRAGVIFGYGAGYGFFAALQGVFIVLYSKYVLKMDFTGSVLLAILVMILIALTAVLTGALVSIFANSEFQVMQFIPVVFIPQIFFSGIIPIDTLPFNLGKLAYIMPVYYGCSSLKDIMIKGYGLDKIWFGPVMLLIFSLVLLFLNTEALRKYRKI